jgi:hypothetical protein
VGGDWRVLGDDKEGVLVSESHTYRYRVEDGDVRIYLPFVVDQERLQELLTEDGWAVDTDDAAPGVQGWGPEHDEEGYYPCWVWPDKERNETVFAFPPRDYKASVEGHTGDGAMELDPVFGPKALEEFTRWIPTLQEAAAKPATR